MQNLEKFMNQYIIILNYIENETKKREDSESTFLSTIEELMYKFRDEFRKRENGKVVKYN